jgi:hypothetical protein
MLLPPDLFAPQNTGSAGPSGFADPPRSFVLRSWHLDSNEYSDGQTFWFDVHQFQLSEAFEQACEQLRELGASRGSVELERIETSSVEIDLGETVPACQRLRIDFVSPTELKDQSALILKPEFAIVARRLITRIANLRSTYQQSPANIDFTALFEEVDKIRMTSHQVTTHYAERFSTRTKQTHPLGGFIGWAEYEGPGLHAFVPYLHAGSYTGVGRQTVWGKGSITLTALPYQH